MSYANFLLALSQLAVKKNAKLTLENSSLHIALDSDKKTWQLSTPLYVGEEGIPSHVRASLPSSSNTMKWQEGAYIKIEQENNAVLLLQDISLPFHYLSFKKHLPEFLSQAEEWKEILSAPVRPRRTTWAFLTFLLSLIPCIL